MVFKELRVVGGLDLAGLELINQGLSFAILTSERDIIKLF